MLCLPNTVLSSCGRQKTLRNEWDHEAGVTDEPGMRSVKLDLEFDWLAGMLLMVLRLSRTKHRKPSANLGVSRHGLGGSQEDGRFGCTRAAAAAEQTRKLGEHDLERRSAPPMRYPRADSRTSRTSRSSSSTSFRGSSGRAQLRHFARPWRKLDRRTPVCKLTA